MEPTEPELEPAVRRGLEALAHRFGLGAGAVRAAGGLLALLAADPTASTTVRAPGAALDVHLADSFAALDLPAVRSARVLADLGSGAGFPGLALAIARPATRVHLVESTARRTAFPRSASAALGLANVAVEAVRAEEWEAGREACDVVAARALAPLDVVLEYAAPLLAAGGTVVAWKGRRDPDEEAAGARAAEALGLTAVEVRRVEPFAGARDRHLHVFRKVAPTPRRFPRRPGVARKRPLGGRASARPDRADP